MARTAAVRVLLVMMLVVGVVGIVDAGRADAWDQVVILTGLTLGTLVLLVSVWFGRPLVALRPDLARWVSRRAAASGEPPGALTDRAVAAYRAGLTSGDEQRDASTRR